MKYVHCWFCRLLSICHNVTSAGFLICFKCAHFSKGKLCWANFPTHGFPRFPSIYLPWPFFQVKPGGNLGHWGHWDRHCWGKLIRGRKGVLTPGYSSLIPSGGAHFWAVLGEKGGPPHLIIWGPPHRFFGWDTTPVVGTRLEAPTGSLFGKPPP